MSIIGIFFVCIFAAFSIAAKPDVKPKEKLLIQITERSHKLDTEQLAQFNALAALLWGKSDILTETCIARSSDGVYANSVGIRAVDNIPSDKPLRVVGKLKADGTVILFDEARP